MAKQSVTYPQIMADLRRKLFKPIYFLMGEEPFFIDQISDFLQNEVLDQQQREFDLTVLYGKDTDVASAINAAKRYPMMSPYQIVIVKEAQWLKDWELLQHYIAKPLSSTILVIAYKYGTQDRRKKWMQELEKNGVLFESVKLRDYEMGAWIKEYAHSKSISVEAKAIEMLTEFLGTDLSKVANELDKLMLTLSQNSKTITPEHVEKNIGISKDFNVFELQDALIARDVLKANRIVNYFAANKKNNPNVVVLSQLFALFSNLMMYHYLADKSPSNVAVELKINVYFVKKYEAAAKAFSATKTMQIIELIRTTDARSKGVDNTSVEDGELLKELIFKILH